MQALVMGIQSSGISASALLEREGWNVRLYDDKLTLANNWRERGDEIYENLDLVVLSPSIPNTHPVLIGAKERGIRVVSELELGAQYVSGEKIVVTGTNGKTTTVDMLEKLLRIMNKRVRTMGNVGYPVSQVALDGDVLDYAIIEASSFQLEYCYTLRPKIAMLLNLSPDHMDRYTSYDEYVEAKKRVFFGQSATDFAVLNADLRVIRELGKRLPSDVKWVSSREQRGDFYVKDNYFYCEGKPLISVRETKARGEHNRFNMMAVMNVAKVLGATTNDLCAFVREYKPLPHRIEYIGTVNGKGFYNDSKGTNVGACLSAIETVGGKIGLIMGGSDKKEDFCEFFDIILDRGVSCVAVTGANAERIYGSAMKVGFTEIEITPDLTSAVELLSNREDVENVLFSPASASFDRYTGYAERGEAFKERVYALKA